MGIAAQITQSLLRTAKGSLGVHNPFLLAHSLDEPLEGAGCLQVEGGAGEAQGLLRVECFSAVAICGAKDPAQGSDGKEVGGLGGVPGLPLMGQRTSWDQGGHVNMGVQELLPGVEEPHGAEWSTQALLSQVEQGLTGALKEETQSGPFIGHHERVQLMGQGEHGVQVGGG